MVKIKCLNYSLGRRGFFSEINNLAFSYIYAQRQNMRFMVNCFFGNCRLKNGLSDYFALIMPESNTIFSAQLLRTMRSHDKSVFRRFAYSCLNYCNKIYKFFHPKSVFALQVFDDIRSEAFLSSISFHEYADTLKKILNFNENTADIINERKKAIDLPKNYIGVHIRRGDKIKTGEMSALSLDLYVNAIKKHQIKNIYVATDDSSVIDYLKESLNKDEYSIYSSPTMQQNGFYEGSFNAKTKYQKWEETIELLFDIDV